MPDHGIGATTLETLLQPDNDRWGVYQLPFQALMRSKDDLHKNFVAALPALKAAYANLKKVES